MVNEGSPLSLLDVVNTLENILTIREGQIRAYVKNPTTGVWEAQSSIPAMPAPATTFATFAKQVSNTTATQMTAAACKRCVIISHHDNTGMIWIGGSAVSNTSGIPLAPGQAQELALSNTNLVWAIAEVNLERLVVAYLG